MGADKDVVGRGSEGRWQRRSVLHIVLGGALAAITGWLAEVFHRGESADLSVPELRAAEARISVLESRVAELTAALGNAGAGQPLAQVEGGNGELVVFRKKELSVVNPEGVLLNLVATDGPVGIRFYKDFGFGNEQVDNPWHMGYIEGIKGYQGLAILRDWRFTAALWDEDGKLIVGRLEPHPPANGPARARFQVRGTVDEVQAMVEGSADQTADIFQVVGAGGAQYLAISGAGDVVIGADGNPRGIFLYDTADGSRYSLQVTNGRLTLAKT